MDFYAFHERNESFEECRTETCTVVVLLYEFSPSQGGEAHGG